MYVCACVGVQVCVDAVFLKIADIPGARAKGSYNITDFDAGNSAQGIC